MKTMLERRKSKANYLYQKGYSIKDISNIMLMDEATIRGYLVLENSKVAPNAQKTPEKLIEKINRVIFPFELTNENKQNIQELPNRFSLKVLYESIDIGSQYYLRKNGKKITEEEVKTFLEKLPGIAYNKTNKK